MTSQPPDDPVVVRRPRMGNKQRRDQIVRCARTVFAREGLAGARTRDIAAEAGINEATLYRHFSSKTELLDEMLVDISQRLHDGGAEVVDRGGPPSETLLALIGFHIDVLVTKPDLIVVQDRDLSSMTPEANHRVRLLQRRYVERWVDVVIAIYEQEGRTLDRAEARVRVHATFGLLNSSPRLPAYDESELRRLLTAMALAALGCRV